MNIYKIEKENANAYDNWKKLKKHDEKFEKLEEQTKRKDVALKKALDKKMQAIAKEITALRKEMDEVYKQLKILNIGYRKNPQRATWHNSLMRKLERFDKIEKEWGKFNSTQTQRKLDKLERDYKDLKNKIKK